MASSGIDIALIIRKLFKAGTSLGLEWAQMGGAFKWRTRSTYFFSPTFFQTSLGCGSFFIFTCARVASINTDYTQCGCYQVVGH